MIDFGSSCFVDDCLTNYVQSRSYRLDEPKPSMGNGGKYLPTIIQLHTITIEIKYSCIRKLIYIYIYISPMDGMDDGTGSVSSGGFWTHLLGG